MNLIHNYIDKIIQLCKIYKVRSLYVFGSVLTNKFNKDSDIDLLVSFHKDRIDIDSYADNYFDFQFALEDIFKRKVDLVCDDAVKNPIFRNEIDSKKQLIYG